MGATFKKAVKSAGHLRMALAGPPGSGKTYSALAIATNLAGQSGSVAVIDTERGSASKYSDLFAFDVLELDTFHPERYIEAISAAAQAGYTVLVIDSLSHAWSGPGGLLEIVENARKRDHSGNSFTAWKDATPLHNRLIDTLTRAPLHVIATMRSKTEYVLETNKHGRTVPRKVGTAPIQRDGVEYEFDIFGEMQHDNTMIVQKSRCPALAGATIARPGADVAHALSEWLRGDGMPLVARPAASAPAAVMPAELVQPVSVAPALTPAAQAAAAQVIHERDQQTADAASQRVLALKLRTYFGTDETGEYKALRAWLHGQLHCEVSGDDLRALGKGELDVTHKAVSDATAHLSALMAEEQSGEDGTEALAAGAHGNSSK